MTIDQRYKQSLLCTRHVRTVVSNGGDRGAFVERSSVIGRSRWSVVGAPQTVTRCPDVFGIVSNIAFNFYDPRLESGFHKERRGIDFVRRKRKSGRYPFNHVPRVCRFKLNRVEKRRIGYKISNWKTAWKQWKANRGHRVSEMPWCFSKRLRNNSRGHDLGRLLVKSDLLEVIPGVRLQPICSTIWRPQQEAHGRCNIRR